MPTNEMVCPACTSRLKRPASLRDGDLFECPMCATEFRIAEQGVTAGRPPRRDDIEEEGEELEVVGGRKRRRRPSRSGAVELGRWIKLGFVHWFPMLPPSIGYCALLVIGNAVVSLACSLLALIPGFGWILALVTSLSILISWSGGMTVVSVQQLQGKRWSFGDFFSGTQWWLVLLLNWLLLMLIYGLLIVVPSAIIEMVLNAMQMPPLVTGLVTTGFTLLAFLCLYPLTWMFSWQLILDGNYGPLEAITENVQMALPNYFRLLPLAMLTLFIRLFGYALFVIGLAGTWPLAVLIETTAYLRLTGRRVVESPSEVN